MKKNMEKPKITVLMPVFNGEKYIKYAIDSILNQSFKDFELLIIDDGSTDDTLNIIQSFKDKRIKTVRNNKNLGLIASLNIGLEKSEGEYIARMDSDDICPSHRLEKQLNFLHNNDDYAICGSNIRVFGKEKDEIWEYPETFDEVKCKFLFQNSTTNVLLKKSLIREKLLRYSTLFPYAEDYEFYVRISKISKIYNIQDPLLFYRQHQNKIGKIYRKIQEESSDNIRKKQLLDLNLLLSEYEIKIHNSIANWKFLKNKNFINDVELWFNKIINANNKSKKYDNSALVQILSEKWKIICLQSTPLGFFVWKKFKNSNFDFNFSLNIQENIKFFLKCLLKRESK